MDDLSLARAGGTGAPVRAATANEDLMHDPCTMSRIPSTDKTANKEPWVLMTSATEVGTKHSHPVRPSQAGLTEGGSNPAEGRSLSQAGSCGRASEEHSRSDDILVLNMAYTIRAIGISA